MWYRSSRPSPCAACGTCYRALPSSSPLFSLPLGSEKRPGVLGRSWRFGVCYQTSESEHAQTLGPAGEDCSRVSSECQREGESDRDRVWPSKSLTPGAPRTNIWPGPVAVLPRPTAVVFAGLNGWTGPRRDEDISSLENSGLARDRHPREAGARRGQDRPSRTRANLGGDGGRRTMDGWPAAQHTEGS